MKWGYLFVIVYLALNQFGCGSTVIAPFSETTTTQRQNATTLANQVNKDRLSGLLQKYFSGRRYTGTDRGNTAELIRNELNQSPFDFLVMRQGFTTGNYSGENIILHKTGSLLPNEYIVIMAHYDTVSVSPGADDNGSACAALIEIARHLSGKTFERSINLIFTDLEEQGLRGSRYFVSQLDASSKIIAAVSLDMLGFTSQDQQNPFPAPFDTPAGDFLAVLTESQSFGMANDFVRNAITSNISLPTVILRPPTITADGIFSDLTRSDHAAFWEKGLPAILLGDTANFRNPNYHKSTDTIDTINMDFLKRAAQAVLVSTYLWAKPR